MPLDVTSSLAGGSGVASARKRRSFLHAGVYGALQGLGDRSINKAVLKGLVFGAVNSSGTALGQDQRDAGQYGRDAERRASVRARSPGRLRLASWARPLHAGAV